MPKIELNVTVVLERDDGGYHASCPAFKGLHTCGATRAAALRNVKDALEAYLLSLIKHHEPIPCCRIIKESDLPARRSTLVQTRIPLPA